MAVRWASLCYIGACEGFSSGLFLGVFSGGCCGWRRFGKEGSWQWGETWKKSRGTLLQLGHHCDNAVVTLWELESESEKEFGINKRLH